jgi:hypothetical protein
MRPWFEIARCTGCYISCHHRGNWPGTPRARVAPLPKLPVPERSQASLLLPPKCKASTKTSPSCESPTSHAYPGTCKYRANHQPDIQSFELIPLRQHYICSLAGLIAATALALARYFALRLRSHPNTSPQNSDYLNAVILALAMPIHPAFRSRRPSLAPG